MHIESNTESKRKLASIQIVDRVDKHTNADSLELTTVLGWQIVTRIGEAKAGDLVVYCEIDSILPKAEWLPDAIKLKIGENSSFRLKTAKLRGEISQGLIVPLHSSMPFDVSRVTINDVGKNVTEDLGITKYEPAMFASSSGTSTFPTHIISKTDEERIQSAPRLLKAITGKPYYCTVKCDGTSGTFLLGPETLLKDDGDPNKSVLLVCSRNQIRPKPQTDEELSEDPYWQVALKYNIEEKLRQLPYMAIQGEICGPRIQLNLLGLKDLEFYVFNVVDLRIPGGRKVDYSQFIEITQKLQLQTVPIEECGNEFKETTIKELLAKAEGEYPRSKKQREGLVFRTQDSMVSFKVISNKYLLKIDQ